MRREHRDPYVVLGVNRQASAADIVHAYRQLARRTHPDSSPARDSSPEAFRAVSDAYETLRDPRRRAAYDRSHPAVSEATQATRPAGSARDGAGGRVVLGRHRAVGGEPALRVGPVHVARADCERETAMGEATLARLLLALLPGWW